jgi:hypothetical protein
MVSLFGEEKAEETNVRGRFLLLETKTLMMGFLRPALDSLVMEDFHLRSSGSTELQSMMIVFV